MILRASERPPGMHDVARLAGVSHQTVSRVINDVPNVRPETRQRVLDAIASLNYRPNSAARALVTRRSSTIGVVTSRSNLWGPSSSLIGVERAARKAGYYVGLASLGPDVSEIRAAIAHFTDQAVEGVIVIAPEAALVHAADPLVSEIPVVMVGVGARPSPGVLITGVDQDLGGVRATRHLIGLGHRRIAHVAGPLEWFDASARAQAWRRELAGAGLPVPAPFLGDWTARSGYEAGVRIRELIRSGRPEAPTAVFAGNDLMALGLIRALHEGGLSVPDDVSVVGFDDMPGSDFFTPGLTTVRQDLEAVGRQCIAILLDAMGHHPQDRVPAPLSPELIVRSSTALPRRQPA